MPDINRATVGGEDAIGVAWHAERQVGANQTPGEALMVPVERWILQVVRVNLTMASDNPDRVRVYIIGPLVPRDSRQWRSA